MSEGIKSKDRVDKYGEVFTPHEIVVDMVNLGDTETIPIEKTYFEPACGDGQFLIEILYRKLLTVKSLPVEQREIALVKSLCSIYAVDIQLDNVRESRQRLLDMAHGKSIESFTLTNTNFIYEPINLGINFTDKLDRTIEFIVKRNIQCGNTLTNRKYITDVSKRDKVKELNIALSTEDDEIGKSNIRGAGLENDNYAINLFGTYYNFDGEYVTMVEEQLNDEIQSPIGAVGKTYNKVHYLELNTAKEIEDHF